MVDRGRRISRLWVVQQSVASAQSVGSLLPEHNQTPAIFSRYLAMRSIRLISVLRGKRQSILYFDFCLRPPNGPTSSGIIPEKLVRFKNKQARAYSRGVTGCNNLNSPNFLTKLLLKQFYQSTNLYHRIQPSKTLLYKDRYQ